MYIKISLHNTKGSHDDLAMSLDTDPHFPKGYHDLTMSHVIDNPKNKTKTYAILLRGGNIEKLQSPH